MNTVSPAYQVLPFPSAKEEKKFNDGVDTFYDDYSKEPLRQWERKLYGLFFSINSKGYFICTISDRIAHIMAFV